MSKYGIGERWYCDRSKSGNHYGRPNFTFLIVAKSDRPGHKICKIVSDVPGSQSDGTQAEYSHKHLNKVAVHVPAAENNFARRVANPKIFV